MKEKEPFRWHDRNKPIPPELQKWFDEEEQKRAICMYKSLMEEDEK